MLCYQDFYPLRYEDGEMQESHLSALTQKHRVRISRWNCGWLAHH